MPRHPDPPFLDDDFLLGGETARSLFHQVAEVTPIVDLHNHLPSQDLAHDRVFETLADLWLGDDHYKWRAMRLAGFEERLVTGDADPWDRFSAWAATVPRLVLNPLYVWTHLELRRVFGIDLALNPSTAKEIWNEANRQLPGWSARTLVAHFDVRVLATTNDPVDDLTDHDLLRHARRGGALDVAVIPTWRPDPAHRLLDDPEAWNAWTDQLAAASATAVDDLASLLAALSRSFERFAALGARASDHGLDYVPNRPLDPALADRAVRQARQGRRASDEERESVLLEIVALAARLAAAGGSVLQMHLGPLRDLSPRIRNTVGRDVGADAIGDYRHAGGIARFLGGLEQQDGLPRTVLYNANPADNALFASLAGAFSKPGVPSLVQWGPPWWFNDHEDGMRRQLQHLAQIGQLAGFMGMLTDSRSLLSMTRHELFRRVLCDLIGGAVDGGRFPADEDWLREMVRNICLDNAVRYFGLPSGAAGP
jgi:glucuronate isomerase